MVGNIWSFYPIFQILKRREGCINVPQPATVSVEIRRRSDNGEANWEKPDELDIEKYMNSKNKE